MLLLGGPCEGALVFSAAASWCRACALLQIWPPVSRTGQSSPQQCACVAAAAVWSLLQRVVEGAVQGHSGTMHRSVSRLGVQCRHLARPNCHCAQCWMVMACCSEVQSLFSGGSSSLGPVPAEVSPLHVLLPPALAVVVVQSQPTVASTRCCILSLHLSCPALLKSAYMPSRVACLLQQQARLCHPAESAQPVAC